MFFSSFLEQLDIWLLTIHEEKCKWSTEGVDSEVLNLAAMRISRTNSHVIEFLTALHLFLSLPCVVTGSVGRERMSESLLVPSVLLQLASYHMYLVFVPAFCVCLHLDSSFPVHITPRTNTASTGSYSCSIPRRQFNDSVSVSLLSEFQIR